MEALIQRKQKHKKITWSAFRDMEIPEGDTSIYELINGEIVKRASPNSPHQRVSFKLSTIFGIYNKKKKAGEFFHAPYDVYFDELTAGVQPDLLFVSNERTFIIHENNGIVGAPDMIVEIVSKGSVDKDRVTKKEVYARFAVKEYWIVDVRNKTVEVYVMDNDHYQLFSFAEEKGIIKSAVLPDFKMNVKAVFD
jgi:Uma2 family endonuclease